MSNLGAQDTFSLTVSVEGITTIKGDIRLCIIDNKEGFPDDCTYHAIAAVKSKTFSTTIPNVKKGQYAISLLHDEDSNTKMNYNFLGIPKEKYGFSNNPNSRFSIPAFEDCLFKVEKATKITIKI